MRQNPLQLIYKHPMMPLAAPLARGAIYTILAAWYEAGCPDLGDHPDYAGIAGMRSNDWDRHKKIMFVILADTLPKIKEFWEHDGSRLKTKRETAANARKYLVKKKILQKDRKAGLLDKEDTGKVLVSPLRPKPKAFREGWSDSSERARIISEKKKTTDFSLIDN